MKKIISDCFFFRGFLFLDDVISWGFFNYDVIKNSLKIGYNRLILAIWRFFKISSILRNDHSVVFTKSKVIFVFWSYDYYRSPLASIIYSALELTDGPTCTENVRYNANVAAEKIRYLVSWNSWRPLDIGLREKSMKWWEPSILTKVTKNRQRKKKFFKNFWREYSKLKITKKNHIERKQNEK